MFGLTFSQLAWAFPGLLLIFIILKIGLPIEVSGTIAVFIAFGAAFFMFFDGQNKVKNLFKYLKNKEIKVNSEQLKEIVDIKEINKGIIQTSKDKLSVLEIIPMNFMIKTEEEQESILHGFQKFLNSLDFPIQIHISSNPINLDKHFDYLETKTNLKDLFQDYKSFVINTLEENKVKNRKFYIIIKEKDNLEIQTKVCEDKLRSIGLKVKRLEKDESLNLFFNYIADNKKKEVQEGEVISNYTHFLLSPSKVKFFPDHFQVDERLCKVLSVIGYPHSVEKGFLDKLISSGDDYDVSIHIEPFPIETTMVQLNRELQKQQADLYADSKKSIINPSLEIKFASTKQVLVDLQKGKQKLFNISLYVMCKSSLKKARERVLAEKEKQKIKEEKENAKKKEESETKNN